MVQKEVADRVVSPPGSRVYGITSVILQTLYEVRVALKVAPGSFQPPPKVASSVLHFQAVAEVALAEDELPGFIALVKNVFQQRRKTLQNTLKSFYSLDGGQLDAISRASGVDLSARPEALSTEDFHRLARSLARESKR
jgi:16S rRNA (adenine1518-N6/adenine1519-N6)-dimethyltransferase